MFQRRQLQELSDSVTRNPRQSEFTHALNKLNYITEFPGSIIVWDTNYPYILFALSEEFQTNSGTMTTQIPTASFSTRYDLNATLVQSISSVIK